MLGISVSRVLRFRKMQSNCLDIFRGGGGGPGGLFRAFINSELGPPEVAPCMARTFGRWSFRILAPNRLRATPRPNMEPEILNRPNSHISQMVLESRRPRWVPNCSPCPSDQPHISIHGSTMKIVDARAISI